MRSSSFTHILLGLIFLGLTTGCGAKLQTIAPSTQYSEGDASAVATPNGRSLAPLSGANVIPVSVNGSTCASGSYPNKPCVSIKICVPGTSNCQVISDILVDTGSYGLRVFKSVLSLPLSPETSGGKTIAQCAQFGDGSKDWGPVELAAVELGGESPVNIPIQVIDSTFSNSSAYCSGADKTPAQAGFNGILGVGLFAQDCGADCVNSATNGLYFACSGSSCQGTSVSLADQLQNPVSALPVDNNGVILELPSVDLGGITAANGYLVLGIGTQTNNAPSGVTSFSADSRSGEFTTTYKGRTYGSFLDSGSNGIFFPGSGGSLPDCNATVGNYAGWFCPNSLKTLTGQITAASGLSTDTMTFQIGNFGYLINSGNNVFTEIGGFASGMFDWGLPFYLGRNIYVGIDTTSSSLGTGPYWAF